MTGSLSRSSTTRIGRMAVCMMFSTGMPLTILTVKLNGKNMKAGSHTISTACAKPRLAIMRSANTVARRAM